MIILNIGGTKFYTTIETLIKYDSFFKGLVTMKDKNNINDDKNKEYFIFLLFPEEKKRGVRHYTCVYRVS